MSYLSVALLVGIGLVALTYDVEGNIIIKTPNKYKYRRIPIGFLRRTDIVFKVKACNDAHIGLFYSNAKMYEIVLGGWKNTKSVIRDKKQGPALKTYIRPVLSCKRFKFFWISWRNRYIRVGRGPFIGRGIFMSQRFTKNFRIRNVGISTGYGSSGVWMFKKPIVSTGNIIVKTPNKYKYRRIPIGFLKRKDIVFKVKACNDAHIGLFYSNAKMYEIVLGGWKNTKSVIRDKKQGPALKTYIRPVLSCKRFRFFWISWRNRYIRVGRGPDIGRRIFMRQRFTKNFRIRNVRISTGYGSSGVWKFKKM